MFQLQDSPEFLYLVYVGKIIGGFEQQTHRKKNLPCLTNFLDKDAALNQNPGEFHNEKVYAGTTVPSAGVAWLLETKFEFTLI